MADKMITIKRRIASVNTAERITSVMKLVAAAKLRKTRKVYESIKNYLFSLINTMTEIFKDTEDMPSEFIAGNRKVRRKCCIVITGSKGFCGSFNNDIIRTAEDYLSKAAEAKQEVRLIAIGSKGRDYFRYHGLDILMEYEAPVDTMTIEDVSRVSRSLIEIYLQEDIDEIDAIYTSYINPLRQEVSVKKLLPFGVSSLHRAEGPRHEVEYGPSPEAVFQYLVPKYVELILYCSCIESAACEYAARRSAMENAHDNTSAMLGKLQIVYNRARQASITNELIEIVAGSQAKQ